MMKKHEHWFTLEINHPYFDKGECSIFDLLPTQETIRIMKNYGIRLQKIKNQYHAYVTVAPSKKTWEELNTAEDLFFQMVNTDVNFDNYTDVILPKKENTVSYITNSEIVNRFNSEMQTVPKTGVAIYPLRFNIPVSPEEKTTVSIKKNNQEIFSQVSLQKQSVIPIDLRAFECGIYELWINNKLSTTFFGTNARLNTNCYGVFQINMRNILESLKENTLPLLKVNFKARATYREYLVIVPEDKKIDIKSMDIHTYEGEQYEAPQKKMVLSGQQEATVFTSTQPIKLFQKPSNHPVLKIHYSHQFSDVLLELDIKMPVPDTSSIITRKKNNENVYYSQTIIYV